MFRDIIGEPWNPIVEKSTVKENDNMTIKKGDFVKFNSNINLKPFISKVRFYIEDNIDKQFEVNFINEDGIHLKDGDILEMNGIPFDEDELEKVEYSIVTDEVEYVDKFDDIIYVALQDIGKMKGINIEKLYRGDVLTNEMLAKIRVLIVDYLIKVTDNHIDLTPPEKEYKLGDKVSLYYGGVPVTATIIKCGYGEYGLLLDGKYELAYIENSDSPTNYIIELQKRINVE